VEENVVGLVRQRPERLRLRRRRAGAEQRAAHVGVRREHDGIEALGRLALKVGSTRWSRGGCMWWPRGGYEAGYEAGYAAGYAVVTWW
jgi:hypothetical protein